MITIGADYHKRTTSYKILDAAGKVIATKRLENSRENIRQFLQSLPSPKRLGMEATRSWGLFHDTVLDLVEEFHLGHPKKMKAITESSTKNDANDAQAIAQLLHAGFFPPAYQSPKDARELRSLLRMRHFLVNQRRALRNQVQTLIDRNLFVTERPTAFKNIFCKKGLIWLKTLALAERERFILDQCLKSWHQLAQQINAFEAFLLTQEPQLQGLEFLRTVPGFTKSKINAWIVLSEIVDIQRFKKAKSLAHYSGLVPRENSSGDKHRQGRLVQDANKHLRTAFVESTLAAIRKDKGLRAYYLRVKEQRNSGVAIIATARKLCYSVFHVLKEQRAYRPETLAPAAACHPSAL
jgi:transposase